MSTDSTTDQHDHPAEFRHADGSPSQLPAVPSRFLEPTQGSVPLAGASVPLPGADTYAHQLQAAAAAPTGEVPAPVPHGYQYAGPGTNAACATCGYLPGAPWHDPDLTPMPAPTGEVPASPPPPPGPTPILEGTFAIFLTPDESIVVAYRPRGADEDKRFVVPAFVVSMATRQSGHTPTEIFDALKDGAL